MQAVLRGPRAPAASPRARRPKELAQADMQAASMVAPERTEEERRMHDSEVDTMSREQLVAEVRRLREGIRAHRDSSGHELCWHHPRLWGLLPEKTDPLPVVPSWPQFLHGCVRYR